MKGAWTIGACALLPALVAASIVAAVPDAAHDAGVARALGFDAAPWGSLDAAVAGLFVGLPVGTRAARAAMGEALAVGAAGAALYAIARPLLAACAQLPRLGTAVAAVAASCATLSPAWQLESSAPGGAALGAMLALVPLALLARADDADEQAPPPRWGLAAFALALSLGQDPMAGACSAASSLALLAAGPRARRSLVRAWQGGRIAMLASAGAGLLPAVVAVARARAAGGLFFARVAAAWAGERAASGSGAPWPLLELELGSVLTVLAVGGAVLALLVARARALGAALVVLAAAGLSSGWAGAALGPTRFGAAILVGLAATCALAGAAMQAVVRLVAEARLPLARASAVMVVVLELVAPVDEADETLRLGAARARGSGPLPDEPAATWDDAAWGALPPLAAVLVTDPAIERRAAAARATGALRGDITVLPVFSVGGDAARALASDARLLPLWRDMTLDRVPGEEALSSLANGRPVFMAFEPEWGKVLGKHLVPAGLFDRFEPEPRGTSDRRKLLDAFTPVRERLARAVVRDRDLSSASALLLRRRLVGLGSSGDRDLVGVAVADLHAFAPDDPVAAQIVAKVVATKGRP